MGRMLITSNIFGCREAVSEKRYLCDTKNIESLYNCIISYIELSEIEKKRIGFKTRQHIEQIFDKKKVVERTISYISKIWRIDNYEN